MTINSVSILFAAVLAFGIGSQSVAQTLAQRSFDEVFQGDDPGEVFTFDLELEPLNPSVVRFDGFFSNLTPLETSVRYELSWPLADGSGDRERVGIDFTPLGASGQLPMPVSFSAATP